MMKRAYTVFLAVGGLVFAPAVWGETWIVGKQAGDFPNVSDVLVQEGLQSGDEIAIRPGDYVDTSFWLDQRARTGIRIHRKSDEPGIVRYEVPWRDGDTLIAITLWSGYELSDIQLSSNNATEIITVHADSTDVQIHNVVISIGSPHKMIDGIAFRHGSSGTVQNCTIVGQEAAHEEKVGIVASGTATVTVSNCFFKNLAWGVFANLHESTEVYYSCFDGVDDPIHDYDLPPTNFEAPAPVAIGSPYYLPPYGACVIDAGSPELFDADGTRRDIGAVPRMQIVHLLGWDEIPTTTGSICDPPRAFSPGDRVSLYRVAQKHEGLPVANQVETTLYLILDVYSSYYFWPSWSQDIDAQTVAVSDGYYESECVLDFIWPAGVGSAYGLRFWGAPVWEGDTGTEHGPIQQLSFGYTT